ncbi:hypothetical protein TSAR_011539 [Trichomalopsis sarcophagae]|uniref:Uncharacterized protein n=1 Tax=Trichomalopsis sarcophagae TaxID=543379 RepID=A0A232FIK1_9HYME|nr:hypothetical protein TSAR_011539 [Trichomalopsis sarcophagae]
MTSRGIIVICCCLVVPGLANPMMARQAESEVDRFEARLASIMDSLNEKDTIGLYGDMVTLERVAVEEQRSATEEAEDDPLMRRIDDFLRSHKLQISFPSDGSSADLFGRALGEKNVGFELRGLIQGASEGRTKLKKILLPVLLALKLKAIIVLPIVITLIGLIGIKGLGAGVLALLLSGAVALKALLTPPAPAYPARVSYAKPYEIHHDHWHRSQEEVGLQAAGPYRAWSPEFSVDPQFSPYPEIPV